MPSDGIRTVSALRSILAWCDAYPSKTLTEANLVTAVKRMAGGGLLPGTDNPQPSTLDIKRFLECFATLAVFEISMRMTTGQGAFRDDAPTPDPSVVRVLDWMKGLTKDE